MNTQKKVFEKLFSSEKVELASQKYEFEKSYTQLVSEFNSFKSEAPQLAKQFSGLLSEFEKVREIGVKESKKMDSFQSECSSTMMALNALGLKESPEWAQIKEMKSEALKIAKELFSGSNFKLFN
jgi:hypothetical protein